ncbi:MAG TPA: GNAT family N-acetyltransferase [Microvirga sp.]|jgi:RimJ/RimL family protein N-acetyltransferase
MNAHALLRPATQDDADAISRIVVAGWRDSYCHFLPPSFLGGLAENPYHDASSWIARLRAPSCATWMIAEAGHEVGVISLTLGSSCVPDADCELTTLYLAADFRGRGLGENALAAARQFTLGAGHNRLSTTVLMGNVRGRRFYERLGARMIGRQPVFEWDGQVIEEGMYLFQ